MRITKTTESELHAALAECAPNLMFRRIDGANAKLTAFTVTLTVKSSKGMYGRLGFSRKDDGERRAVGSACWHGYRDFFRALYRQWLHDHSGTGPQVTSGLDAETHRPIKYTGPRSFEATHAKTGLRNIGSMADPLTYRDACHCESTGQQSGSMGLSCPDCGSGAYTDEIARYHATVTGHTLAPLAAVNAEASRAECSVGDHLFADCNGHHRDEVPANPDTPEWDGSPMYPGYTFRASR